MLDYGLLRPVDKPPVEMLNARNPQQKCDPKCNQQQEPYAPLTFAANLARDDLALP